MPRRPICSASFIVQHRRRGSQGTSVNKRQLRVKSRSSVYLSGDTLPFAQASMFHKPPDKTMVIGFLSSIVLFVLFLKRDKLLRFFHGKPLV